MSRVTLLWLVVGALLGFTCTVNLPDGPDGGFKYSCAATSDCGGDGWVCALAPGNPGVCCMPSGIEVCDKIDNNCDGIFDNSGLSETCNGKDDDCDDKVDNGYNLQSDPNNCGSCNKVCTVLEACTAGECVVRKETACADFTDNDGNGLEDCLDPSCELRPCSVVGVPAAGCLCVSLLKTETICDDNVDNDGDSSADCRDVANCAGKSCGMGCVCAVDGGRTEIACDDNLDNDKDGDGGFGNKDCDDNDCQGKFCTPPDIYFTCAPRKVDGGSDCKCNNGVQVSEVGSVLCVDDIDNDCNGKKDCAESSCDGLPCLSDGGTGCTCAALAKKEINCSNSVDDDGDNKVDCADSDCVQGTICTTDAGGAGTCTTGQTCN